MELAFILVYAAILGLVAPYLGIDLKLIGSLVPGAIALVFGTLSWAALTWVGLPYDEAWIWLIVMLGMPAAIWFGAKYIDKRRAAGKSLKPVAKKDNSNKDDAVILSA